MGFILRFSSHHWCRSTSKPVFPIKENSRVCFTFWALLIIVWNIHLLLSIKPKYHYLHPGLCGDFNDVEADDFRTTNGLIEGTAGTFANTWMTKASCPDTTNILKDPCSLSVDKGICLRPHAPYFNIILHNILPINICICFCREICQTLVLLAVRPKRDFLSVPFWNKPRRLSSCKQWFLFVCSLMYVCLWIDVFVLFYLFNNCTFHELI